MAEDPPPPADKMTDDDADTLRDLVIDLRRTLPDPTARDIADAIASIAEDDDADGATRRVASLATANRVKKLNTRLNKETREKESRDMLEPDETDGPLVLEELIEWPSETSLREHLAEDLSANVFRASERARRVAADGEGEGEDAATSTSLEYRRALCELAGFHDAKYVLWTLTDEDETSELMLVCDGVRRWRRDGGGGKAKGGGDGDGASEVRAVFVVDFLRGNPRSGAHKRALAAAKAKHAGEMGKARASAAAQDVFETHLRRNRHYDDKYAAAGDAAGDGARDAETPRRSYVVTPAPEWFR